MFGEKVHGLQIRDGEKAIGKELAFSGGSEPDIGGGLFGGCPVKPQELTLSYLCENNFKMRSLGVQNDKPLIFPSASDETRIERDFLSLNKTMTASPLSKRKLQLAAEDDEQKKKHKLESALNLSLALPYVSTHTMPVDSVSNRNPAGVFVEFPSNIRCNDASNNNDFPVQTACSDDFTTSFYTCSQPYSHNPSCSLTRNSDTFDCSVSRDNHIWCAGEGTNGSVHSRFRPIGEGIVSSNGNVCIDNGRFGLRAATCAAKESCNDNLDRSLSSDNVSFLPSELPAKQCLITRSGDSRKWESEQRMEFDNPDVEGRARKVSRPERVLFEIVSESIPIMTRLIKELPQESLESTKRYLKNVLSMPEKKNELIRLQIKLERRSDLSVESLLKCSKDQLEIMVALKTGLEDFISGNIKHTTKELIDIFMFKKCRNMNCKSMLPVDDCDCKICSGNKGFCSSCMCPVCMKFDCASNTCSWVGCDACSHWCHALCGLEKNLIRPGRNLNGRSGASEMLFNCIACDHTSEMFGFVRDVFVCCAKDWGLETLIKELDCVRKIFKGSNDSKGMQLHMIAEDLFCKLDKKHVSASAASDIVIRFFNDSGSDFCDPKASTREFKFPEAGAVHLPPNPPLPPKFTAYNMNTDSASRSKSSADVPLKDVVFGQRMVEDKDKFNKMFASDAFNSLESIILVKEAEALMFQSKADQARQEALNYKQMIISQSEKLEEHELRLSNLCLQETEERKKKKQEELKMLENSHSEYYKLKRRMQSEIASLLKRMEATKRNETD